MLDINLNLYKIFNIVAKSKSYSDASNKLHMSTQAISKNIIQLENILGTKLFFHDKNGIKLTAVGNDLFKHIDIALSSIDLAEKITFQKNDLSAGGEINIGCPSHLTTFYLIDCIEKTKKDYPNLKIKLISGSNQNEMIQLLQEHKIDFIIDTAHIETNYNNIVIKEMKELENIFISKQPLIINDLKDLENLKYILNFEYTSTTRKLMETLAKYNISINVSMECDITELRINCAKRDLGIAYVMKESVKKDIENKELYEVTLPIKLQTSKMNLIYLKEQLTNADKIFIKKYLKYD